MVFTSAILNHYAAYFADRISAEEKQELLDVLTITERSHSWPVGPGRNAYAGILIANFDGQLNKC